MAKSLLPALATEFVNYSVGVNPGVAARKGTITIAGQTFSIKQKGNASSHR